MEPSFEERQNDLDLILRLFDRGLLSPESARARADRVLNLDGRYAPSAAVRSPGTFRRPLTRPGSSAGIVLPASGRLASTPPRRKLEYTLTLSGVDKGAPSGKAPDGPDGGQTVARRKQVPIPNRIYSWPNGCKTLTVAKSWPDGPDASARRARRVQLRECHQCYSRLARRDTRRARRAKRARYLLLFLYSG